ncbi:hypothetical protein N8I77_013009 [Diaporthe amygdali]|uniref:GS catalytic domain-containing protein n=1 Tax=Phomopsis amygdali TaxID=1214568 RepID=A0AAD9S223_PHOAM|nr:hypothetical protein N8I77_013009 [Diaporthe amygdali]
MDPPSYGYEYWKHYHSDCELVHVIWTDYFGILHEKLISADTFNRMYRKDAYKLDNADNLSPLTVSLAALTTLPDGKSAANSYYKPYVTCDLVPDYATIQHCIDSRSRATVFAKVDTGGYPLADPREILKKVSKVPSTGKGQKIRAALEFQFVLRNLSDGKIYLAKGDGPAQNILQKLARGLRTHAHSTKGLSIISSDIANDGVVTVKLVMSDNVLEAVDNYYRTRRALQSLANLDGLRPSFFYASQDVPGAAFSGTPHDVMCKNKLHCRLRLSHASAAQAWKYAAAVMDVEAGISIGPSIYAFARPNWLTYAQRRQYDEDPSPKRQWMTWGIQNFNTAISLPENDEETWWEFGDVDCMANMYLVMAAISVLGSREVADPAALGDIAEAKNVNEYVPDSSGPHVTVPRKIPRSGFRACHVMSASMRLHGSLLEDINELYSELRGVEDEDIVAAVASGRASSARQLLADWY